MVREFLRNKLPVWDLGGSLNELDPPSETPQNDVIDILNWKVHKDGHSRVKRPGCGLLDTGYESVNHPIRGIFEYEDENNNQHVVIVTRDELLQRTNLYTWTRTFLDNDADYTLGYRQPVLYQDKLVIIDHGPDSNKEQILGSVNGTNFVALDNFTPSAISVSHAQGVATLNNQILYGLYANAGGDKLIARWDGVTTFTEELNSPTVSQSVLQLFNWDGKIWILLYGTDAYRVYHWNGTSYSAITNYDGAGTLETNSTQILVNSIRERAGRFFNWNNNLYLFVTVKSGGKWRFQIWKFNASLYDRFNKIYDHAVSDDYGICAVYEYDGKIWVILQKLDYVGDANPNGDDNKIYYSEDLNTWTSGGTASMGWIMGDAFFDGKIFLNSLYGWGTNNYTAIWVWDNLAQQFILEQSITTNPPPVAGNPNESTGDLIVFNGYLYVAKYREIYKRDLSSNVYSEIFSHSQAVETPVAGAYWQHRFYLALETNLVLEGDDVYYLGINAPVTAPTVGLGAADGLSGDYYYLTTFYRSGNYPCESNPSPESALVQPVGQKVNLTNIPISGDPKVNARRIYRTTAGGAIFYWLDDILDNVTTTYEDSIDDDTLLGGDEVSYDRYPPPSGKYMEVWDNRLWIAGVSEYPNMLFFTNTGTSEEMASTNFIQIRARGSEPIKQIKAFGDLLYVFLETSMFRVSKVGASLFEVEELAQNIGLECSWSVAVCDKFMIWKSAFGIEVFNGNSCFRPICSRLVQRTLATLNKSFLDKVVGGHHFDNGEYWLSIPTGSAVEPDKVIIFDYLDRRFTVYSFPAGITYSTSLSLRYEGLLFLTGTEDGYIYTQDTGYDDNGVAIESYFQLPWYYVSTEREIHNILRRMFIKYTCPDSHAITMDFYTNFKKTSILTKDLDGSTPTSEVELRKEILKRINLGIYGIYVSIKFTQNTLTGGEVKIEGFDLYFNRELFRHSVTGD